MLIGIDGTCWWNRRGFGRFVRGLLPAMFAAPRGHTFRLFIDQPPEAAMRRDGVETVVITVGRPVTQSAVAGGSRAIADVMRFSRAASASQLDVMFFPAVYSWFPVFSRVPKAVTLHDAIAERFPQLTFGSRQAALFWRIKMELACRSAGRFMTVTDSARREIVEFLHLPADRIDVLDEGADQRFAPVVDGAERMAARARSGIPAGNRLLLYVGGIAPHKNLGNLLRGFAIAAGQVPDLALAIVGDPQGDGFHSNYDETVALAASDPRMAGRVHFTGFVSDDDLPALYSDALALVLPSFSEGFGLPALEAISCGTPVLSAPEGAVAEVVGDTGLTFDPHRPEEIAGQILRLACEPQTLASLQSRALIQARKHSWQRAAELALLSLERLADGP